MRNSRKNNEKIKLEKKGRQMNYENNRLKKINESRNKNDKNKNSKRNSSYMKKKKQLQIEIKNQIQYILNLSYSLELKYQWMKAQIHMQLMIFLQTSPRPQFLIHQTHLLNCFRQYPLLRFLYLKSINEILK